MAKLQVEISVLDKITNEIVGINRTMTNFVGNVEKTFGALTKGFVAIGAMTGAVVGIKSVISNSLALADAVKTQADRFGMSTKAVQEWDYALRQNGSSMDAAGKAFTILAKNTYEAYQGSKSANETFKLLGVSIRDNNGVLKSNSEFSKEVILTLAGIENNTERAAMAQRVFGKSASEMLPLLSKNREELEATLRNADRFGQVLSESTVKSLDDAGDALGTVGKSMQVFGAEMVNIISGPLTSFSLKIAEAATALRRFFKPDELTEEEKTKEKLTSINRQLTELNSQLSLAKTTGQQFIASFAGGTIIKTPVAEINAKVKELEKAKKELEKVLNPAPKNAGKSSDNKKEFDWLKYYRDIAESEKMVEDDRRKRGEENTKKLLDQQKQTAEKQIALKKKVKDYEDWAEAQRAVGIARDKERADQATYDAVDNLEYLASQHKEFAGIYKAAAIAKTISETYFGAQKAYTSALEGIPPPANLIAAPVFAGIAVAAGLANIRAIATQRFASGGTVKESGFYRVGEQGPETAYLQSGTQIMRAMQTTNNNDNRQSNLVMNFYGAGRNAVETLRASIRSGSADRLVKDLKMAMAS